MLTQHTQQRRSTRLSYHGASGHVGQRAIRRRDNVERHQHAEKQPRQQQARQQECLQEKIIFERYE